MPLLGGIFGKKNKSSAPSVNGASYGASLSPSSIDSLLSSPTASYITTDKSLPSSPNGKSLLSHEAARPTPSHVYPSIAGGNSSASSSKLRLPFGRKKSKPPIPDASESFNSSSNANFMPPPRLPYATRLSTSTASDSDTFDTQHLRPPPSKSAIFATYGDPNSALSTRSLPDDSMHSWASMYPPSAPSTPQKPPKEKEKRPSLFSWTKSSSSSRPTEPPPLKPPRLTNLDSPPRLDIDSSSFNLKSFRHVRPPSPTASTSSLVVPPARPRGASIASDSSQRISVAAFREAQARRSTADSPVPSFRSPSPSLPTGFPPDGQRGRPSPRPSPVIQPHSSPHLKNGVYNERRRSTNLAVGYTSESEESTASSEEEESDEEGAVDGKNGGVQRGGTITARTRTLIGTRQAKSEIGHGSHSYASPVTANSHQPSTFLTTKSQNGHDQVDSAARQSSFVANSQYSPVEPPPPRSKSSLGIYDDTARRRASNSTSALSPTPAAKRASILASANASLNQDPLAAVKQNTRHVRDSSSVCSNPALQLQPKTKAVDTDTSDSESDSDSDSDNAPLASLVPPRRPGSALSSASNTSLRTNGTRGPAGRAMTKPLIDINELTAKKPSLGPQRDNEEGFTKSGLLAAHLSSQASSVLVESPTSTRSSPLSGSGSSLTGVTSRSLSGFGHFAPPTSPAKEIQAYASLGMQPGSSTSRPQSESIQKPDAEKESDGERSPEKRRDVLTERLAKLAKGKEKENRDGIISLGGNIGIGDKKNSASSPPLEETPLRPATSSKLQTTQPSASLVAVNSKPSLPDDDLIQDVDDSILRLISRMGEFEEDAPTSLPSLAEGEKDDDTSDSESDVYGEPENKKSEDKGKASAPLSERERDRIAPITIRQREPLPSFSVMSRPPIQQPVKDSIRSSLTAASLSTNTNTNNSTEFSASSARNSTATDIHRPTSDLTLNSFVSSAPSSPPSATTRQRSSSLMPSSPSISATSTESSSSTFGASTSSFAKLKSSSKGGESNVVSSSSASSTNVVGGRSSSRPSSANLNRASVLRTVASGEIGAGAKTTASISPGQTARQRSSSMIPLTSTLNSKSNQFGVSSLTPSVPPAKPFAVRRDSPASSTGDSSSTRAPLTPQDGSDIGSSKTAPSSGKKEKEQWNSGVSGLGVSSGIHSGTGTGRHVQRRSVSFDDDVDKEVKGKKSKDRMNEDEAEARRRERRRGEAKAAIELGNVINGPGPVVSDDEDDLPINQAMNARVPTMNPMMAMPHPMQMQMSFSGASGSPAGWGGNLPLPAWPQPGGAPQMPQMISPGQFMMPPPANPNYIAAHQQAMMFAKQAYQMAVAQQAMAAASDEWDRNSVMGGSVYGGPSSNASVMMGPSPYNMMGMGGMGNGWSNGQMMFPNSSQSVYGGRGGISSSRSEYGGPSSTAAGNWGSARSSYGESFGPSERLKHGGGNRKSGAVRDSGYYPPMPPIPQSHSGGSSSSGTKGRLRTASGPATPSRGGMKKPPPSSWKAGV